jgi:hypothetical protein
MFKVCDLNEVMIIDKVEGMMDIERIGGIFTGNVSL